MRARKGVNKMLRGVLGVIIARRDSVADSRLTVILFARGKSRYQICKMIWHCRKDIHRPRCVHSEQLQFDLQSSPMGIDVCNFVNSKGKLTFFAATIYKCI